MGITERLDAARGVIVQTQAERQSMLGAYLKDFVYGGLDGIITTFAVVAGVAGAQLAASIILILGIANLLADGFSMGTGDYLSTKSEREFYAKEAASKAQAIAINPQQERENLLTTYLSKGYSDIEAQQLVDIQTNHAERWVTTAMFEQRNMLQADTNPLNHAFATFIAFIIAGSLPLLVYIVGLVVPIAPEAAFPISIVSAGIALFLLGAAKVYITHLNPVRSGLEMLIVGGLAAAVAYIVGVLLKNVA